MSPWAIIAVGFLVPIAVGVPTRLQPLLVGFAWPLLVAIGAVLYVTLHPAAAGDPNAALAIPFAALFSLAGGVPGGVLGWIIKLRLARRG
ncbi:hypothetical protein U1701_00520 [Sphingomonas sp. PB2P19]|uniref:hypothetical protein n=1 Tax=Sphingomonas rhamnosi TaxID=3096156 RepID=UPI002FC9149C